MKTIILTISFIFGLGSPAIKAQSNQPKDQEKSINNVEALKDTLRALASRTSNELFALSCESMLLVIDAKTNLTTTDESFLTSTYDAFINYSVDGCPANIESYLKRQRSFIIAWVSPTDGEVSYSWLKLPLNWNPDQEYPMYVQLHGLWGVADNPIEYMTYPFRGNPSSTYAFENGYLLSPWGRGNFWYEGISETDIWECMDALERVVSIDKTKKYLCGHSMGGYGAWNIGQKSANTWAALGIHAGAIWYGNNSLVTNEVAENLSKTPVYFVCGTNDGLLDINILAYDLLAVAGNNEIEFVTFEGGHDYRSEDVERMYDWMSQFTTSVKKHGKASDLYNIQISPNPFISEITIGFSLSKKANVRIEILNCFGQVVDLVIDSNLASGTYTKQWEPKNSTKGMYFCNFLIGDYRVCKRMLFY